MDESLELVKASQKHEGQSPVWGRVVVGGSFFKSSDGNKYEKRKSGMMKKLEAR